MIFKLVSELSLGVQCTGKMRNKTGSYSKHQVSELILLSSIAQDGCWKMNKQWQQWMVRSRSSGRLRANARDFDSKIPILTMPIIGFRIRALLCIDNSA